ncbi:MAG: ABC-type transport auxiliary lipoprotein family protein [Alphaproteobacteria bacterium]|nr:ABC-type transport auxiliary lipoprotein family protein [Alphaproteobacteria bacterium]
MIEQRLAATCAGIGARVGLAAVIAAALIALGACSSIIPGADRDPPRLYDLSPKSTFAKNLPRSRWQLVVEPPIAAAGLSSARIALKRHHLRIEYYAQAAWTDTTPTMIQTLIIESFENSKKIVSVGRTSAGLRSDFVLQTSLREFQAEYGNRGLTKKARKETENKNAVGPVVRVSINAKLVKMPERTIIASRTFQHTVIAASNSMEEIVAAFDDALGKALKRIVRWTLVQGHRGWRRRHRTVVSRR